ncbi:MAG: RodZ domain-containing protein [Gammaproteobacteria bacterium]
MDGVDEQAKDAQRPTGVGPGERLQAARIQMGLSLADVAKRMHLSASIVEAIEDNHFEEITAPIFVKGYLRAYARIVSLDEDDMIDQYFDFYSGEDPPISSISNVASELSVADARVKWTTYIVVLIIGVSLAAWLWNEEQNTEAPISLDTQSSSIEEPAKSDADVVSSEIEAVSEELIEAGETVESTTTQPASVTAAEVEPAASAATQQPSIEAGEVTESDVVEVEVVESEALAGEAVEVEVVESEALAGDAVEAETGSLETTQGTRNEPTRIAPVGSDKVKLVVHADTWADIKDANSYQLVYDLLRADEAVELMGQAPFSVFLGNGHGVEIMFNGEEIDVAPRIRDDNTARLKIGG